VADDDGPVAVVTMGVEPADVAAEVGGAAAEETVMDGSSMTFGRFLATDDVTVTGGGGVAKKKVHRRNKGGGQQRRLGHRRRQGGGSGGRDGAREGTGVV